MNEVSRNTTIDVLRGVAILMVMLLHFSLTYGLWDNGPLVWLVGRSVAWSLLGWGNYGVTVFFVVSGYLITRNTIERAGSLSRVGLRAFYARRAARILPCLIVAVLIIVLLGLAGLPSFAGNGDGTHGHLLLGALSVLGFFHNILMQRLGYFNYCLNVYWSLSVEEVFYIALPLACVVLRRDWLIAAMCVVLIVVAPLFRAAHADNDILYLYANVACFDAIAIGCLTALLSRVWAPSRIACTILRVAGPLAIADVWFRGFGGSHKVLGFTYIALATAATILSSLGKPDRAVSWLPAWPPVAATRWLGRHSYELYLFHILVLAAMRDLFPASALSSVWQFPWLAVFLLLSCLTAREVASRFSDPANRVLRSRLLSAEPILNDTAVV